MEDQRATERGGVGQTIGPVPCRAMGERETCHCHRLIEALFRIVSSFPCWILEVWADQLMMMLLMIACGKLRPPEIVLSFFPIFVQHLFIMISIPLPRSSEASVPTLYTLASIRYVKKTYRCLQQLPDRDARLPATNASGHAPH